MLRSKIERALEIYTLEEILELNDLSVEEALSILISEGYISLPEVLPIWDATPPIEENEDF